MVHIMEGKSNDINPYDKSLKRHKGSYPSNTAVIHNGSFMTEAFHSQSHETYEENEVVSIDPCFPYTVCNGSQADSHTMRSDISETDQLALFSSCDNGTPNVVIHPSFSAVNVEQHDNSLCYEDHTETSPNLHVGNDIIRIGQNGTQNPKLLSDLDVGDSLVASAGPTIECATSAYAEISSAVGSNGNNATAIGNLPSAINILSSSHQYVWHPTQNSDVNRIGDNISQESNAVQLQGKEKSKILSLPNYGPSNQLTYTDDVSAQKSTGVTFLPEITNGDILSVESFKRQRLSAIVGHDNVTSANALNSADNQVTAFISLPSVTHTDSALPPAADAGSSLQILNSIGSDGILKVIDGNGRMYHIQQSHTEVMTTTSNDLQHDLVSTPASTSVITSGSNGHSLLSRGNYAQLDNDSTSSPTKPGRSRKSKSNTVTGKRQGGWPKGLKRKPERFRIKAPKTAYLLFAKKRRRELNEENQSYTFSEITVMMGREWTGLDLKLKDEYRKQADEDQTRFRAELKEYQQTEDYQNILKRKRDETTAKIGVMEDEDLGYVEEEFTLFCHICDQRFKSQHNRREHLAGRFHLNNLQAELRKQQQPESSTPRSSSGSVCDDPSHCCSHCVNRAIDLSVDTSFDINSHMEAFLYKHSQRELELQLLRQNVKMLKDVNSQLSKELITLQEKTVKLKQETQVNKQWELQLTTQIDNLKMVPNIFGVINF